MANNNKIEKDAVYIVGMYLNKCPKLDHIINTNDKTPIYDGNIYAYNDDDHKIDNYFATVPLQVKGTTSTKDYYRIAREYIEGYKKDKGCIFFWVQESINPPKIHYVMLTVEDLDQLLQQTTKTIRINLNEVPTDPKTFETEIFAFASQRNGEKVENSSPKEIADLVEGFEEIRVYLNEIEVKEAKYELESALDQIKNLKSDDTIGWRDKFIYYSRKAIDLAINNINDYNCLFLYHNLGKYLHEQKLFHLVEDYYLKSLVVFRKQNDIVNVATTLNNLGVLHKNLTHYKEAEQEYIEALKIRRELSEINREVYISDMATTLNNLASLHDDLNRYKEAEQEYKEALKIRRELSEINREANIADVAMTLNNLANLHVHFNHYKEALQEYIEALKIRRELAKTNHDAYIADEAMTLNNIANLHVRLNRYVEAEQEYQEALEIFRELSKKNPNAYIGNVAMTLNNLAILHGDFNRKEEAEQEYMEALKIRRELAKKYPDAYIGKVAMILENLARLLQKDEKRLEEARETANEALGIYKELANKYPQIWNSYVDKTQRLLDKLMAPNHSSSTKV